MTTARTPLNKAGLIVAGVACALGWYQWLRPTSLGGEVAYVVVDGAVQSLSPAAMAILRALARRPGVVVARRELLRTLPGSASDPHAVDTAVLRLRKALGDRNIVATVVKRGYRLAIDESSDVALI